MYKIEKKDYGFKLTFSDFIKTEEMNIWLKESQKLLMSATKDFGIFVDMRDLKPLPAESQILMGEGQKLYKKKGMLRSVVILNSSSLTMQFKRIAKETGIYQWERYIDASKITNWEKIGVDWVKNAIDPDK
ncbi:MAG: hypothetical protein V1773_15610 [bacterium]